MRGTAHSTDRSGIRWLGPVPLIGLASVMNVASGVVLKQTGSSTLGIIVIGFGLAMGLNILRFFIWRRAHRRYPLSLTYPLTGLTFPIAILASLYFDEPVGILQVGAALIIAVGVALVNRSQEAECR